MTEILSKWDMSDDNAIVMDQEPKRDVKKGVCFVLACVRQSLIYVGGPSANH